MSISTEQLKGLRRLVYDSPLVGPLVTLILIFTLSWLFVPNFGTMRTVSGIMNAVSVSGIVAAGIAFLMISGEFDLSVGASIAFGSYLYAHYTTNYNMPLVGISLAILVPALLGAINGIIRVKTRIHSFVVTLGTRSIYRGLVWVVFGGITGGRIQNLERPPLYSVINGPLTVVNDLFEKASFRTATIWLIGLVIFLEYVLMRTSYGNRCFAVGGNPSAAAAQGIPVNRVRVMNFALAGALAGFAGVVEFSQFGSVRVATGEGLEFTAVAAAVVGGALLSGGVGSIWGALIGVILISTLRTTAVLLGLPSDNFEAIVGVAIVLAVILNNWIRQRV